MTIGTTAARTGSGDDDFPRSWPLDDDTAPYCSACGHWAGIFGPDGDWQHWRGHPAPNGTRAPFDAGHEVELAWFVPPAQSISPAQLVHLLAALDDAISLREHATSSGYATHYRMLRRQLARTGLATEQD